MSKNVSRETSGLTPAQKDVIETFSGNIAVNAGAGTGKTRTLTERFVNALKSDSAYTPRSVLAITYTEAAAEELRSRIQRTLRAEATCPDVPAELGAQLVQYARDMDQAWISTIHAFCARILRLHALDLGISPTFTVLDEEKTRELRAQAHRALFADVEIPEYSERSARYARFTLETCNDWTHDEINGLLHTASDGELCQALLVQGMRAQTIRGDIDRILNVCVVQGVEPTTLAAQSWESAAQHETEVRSTILRTLMTIELAQRFMRHYLDIKQRRGVLDFDDLLIYARRLFQEHPRVAAHYRAHFRMVMIDEFQDTSRAMMAIIDPICSDNLCIVGDSKQSIFSFNGADMSLISDIADQWEDTDSGIAVQLSTNFRSEPALIEAINELFAHEVLFGSAMQQLQPPKSLETPKQRTSSALLPLEIVGVEMKGVNTTVNQEARLIAEHCATLIEDGVQPAQIAVLTHRNTISEVVLRELETLHVNAEIVGGRGFYREPLVIDIQTLAHTIYNPHDDAAFLKLMLSLLGRISDEILAALGQIVATTRVIEHSENNNSTFAKDDFVPQNTGSCSLYAAATVLVTNTTAYPATPTLPQEDLTNLAHLIDTIEHARYNIGRRSLVTILNHIYRTRGIFDLWASQPGSKTDRQRANYRKILRFADEIAATQGIGLAPFLRELDAAIAAQRLEPIGQWHSDTKNAVRVMTIHKSKGLEFDYVAVLGAQMKATAPRNDLALANPVIPSQTLAKQRDYDERIRLLYVALTRARKHVFLTHRVPANPPRDPAKTPAVTDALTVIKNERSLGRTVALDTPEHEHLSVPLPRRPDDVPSASLYPL
ncbi:MAG: UvrD-helicase domain-containing protein [Coriobacteriia bacterium]|nr:UvrD-helicase domain-containing protein [Coriobacteriia bacterium]